MEKLEDWFLYRFIPWFMYLSTIVGVVTIIVLVSNFLSSWLNLDIEVVLLFTLILPAILYFYVKETNIKRKIESLLDENQNDIKTIIKDGLIVHPVLNRLTVKITTRLYEEGITDTEGTEEGDKIYTKVEKAIFAKCRKQSNCTKVKK